MTGTRGLEIVVAADAPGDFAAWRERPDFAAIEAHPYRGGFARAYYPAVFGEEHRDLSFAVIAGEALVAMVECDLTKGILGRFSMPLHVVCAASAPGELRRKAAARALRHLVALAGERRARRLVVADDEAGGHLTPLAKACLDQGGTPEVALALEADLTGGEAGLHKALRKSYRSLVNRGRREMALRYVNAATPDRDLMDAYRDFHARIAGGATRSGGSWEAMYDWIVAGQGELVLGYLDGALVSGVMVVDGRHTAAYASGVYEREMFDRPLAHWPLFHAMVRSGERGLRLFDLGEAPVGESVSDKERNIGYFKRGFASQIAKRTVWTIASAGVEDQSE